MGPQAVFAVHVVRQGGDIGAIEMIMNEEEDARRYARDRSRDTRFWSASVTRYHVGVLGSRQPIAWYVDGQEQDPTTPRRYYGTDGPVLVADKHLPDT